MIRKRPSGRYQVQIDNGFDRAGKRLRIAGGAYRTKAEAQKAERAMLQARDRGFEFATSDATVVGLIELYVVECEKNGLSEKTVQEYRNMLDCRFRGFVSVRAAQWKPAQVNAWIALLLERGGQKDENGKPRSLSAKTVKHAMALGNAAYRFGKRMEIVQRNPFEYVASPKLSKTPAKMLSGDELRALQGIVRGTRWEAFITIALWLGPRRGEAIALDWSAYNEEAKTLSIHCAIVQTRKGVKRKDTKTGLTREIPVPPIVTRALARQRALQSADELAAPHGAYKNAADAIFTDELGRRYTPMAATNAFQRLARKAKLSTTRLHDLRHHAASELLGTGTDPALVAAIMGHTIETLLRTYAHARPDGQREKRIAIEKLSARLEAASGRRT
ncbi:MAG: site-specific integrase [Candidatus Cybelea sp.]